MIYNIAHLNMGGSPNQSARGKLEVRKSNLIDHDHDVTRSSITSRKVWMEEKNNNEEGKRRTEENTPLQYSLSPF